MATLEKIRSKSVLLIIVIGVALLAFIVGDALTNSRNLFGDQTTVAKVGGKKIDYTEYQRKREELNSQLENLRRQNPAQYSNFDTQTLGQMAIEQLIAEKLIDEAVENVGIRCTGEQLRYYVMDQPVSPKLQEIIQQLQAQGISAVSGADAYNKIFNPKANGLTESQMVPFQKAWVAMEDETKKLVARQTYQRLLYNTIKANDLDTRSLYNDFVNTTNVGYVFLPFGQLDEKKYPVSAAEIQEAYNNEKYKFSVDEETKDISVITVNVAPSAADRKAAQELARKTVAVLSDSTGNGITKQLRKDGVSLERKNMRASDIRNNAVKEFVASAAPGSVKAVSEGIQGFTIVKMGKREVMVDSIELSLVHVVGGNLPSKVLATLNSGSVPVDSITKIYGNDSVMVQPAQWIELFSAEGRTQALADSQLDSLMNAGGKYIAMVENPQGAAFAKIVNRSQPKEIYEFEEADFTLVPSTKTINDERTKLEKFLASNNTAAKFNENAAKAGYAVQTVSVSQSTPALPRMMAYNQYYPNSRQVLRWVMIDGEKGEVSHIFESKDAVNPQLYAVAIDDEYEDYVSANNVDLKKYLSDKVRRSKAGDALVKQYKPKAQSLQSAATAMGVDVRNDSTFRFGRRGGFGDASIMGRINGTKADKKVVIMKGEDGVYVYQVVGKGQEKFPYDAKQYEQQYFQLVNPQLMEMLKGSRKVKNNSYKFEAGE